MNGWIKAERTDSFFFGLRSIFISSTNPSFLTKVSLSTFMAKVFILMDGWVSFTWAEIFFLQEKRIQQFKAKMKSKHRFLKRWLNRTALRAIFFFFLFIVHKNASFPTRAGKIYSFFLQKLLSWFLKQSYSSEKN